jgi:4-amino-4-deoxy-L-arabinose transferase-like glycosyltransferase
VTGNKRWAWWLGAMLLAIILSVAFWLRWTYVQGVSPYVDEYITLRAAQQILERGLPILPTGNFYSHGLILSYVESGIMALTGFDPLAARLPVLLYSLLTVALTWWLGTRWFSLPVGLLSAALLALTPDAIIWGGRARMYVPLQFFVLLAVFFYWGALTSGRWRNSALFAFCFLGALFHHAEAMVLLPVFLLIAVSVAWPALRRDGLLAVLRHWWRTGLIVAWIVAALGVLLELWFRQLGPSMVSRLAEGVYSPSERVYVHAAWDWPGIRKTLQPILGSPLLLGLLGLPIVELALLLFRRRRHPTPLLPNGWVGALGYLTAIFGLTLPVLLFVADPSWKSPRYLFMLLPVFYLALAAGIFGLLAQISSKQRWQWALLGIALVFVITGSWPSAWAAAHEEVAGYDHAFEYVAAHWQPDDAVMTFVPQAADFALGGADYVSVPTDYRGFAYEQDGRWLDGWDAIPMVDSGAGVADVLAAHDRLWFVVDQHRFHSRFAPGFAQAVWDGMDLIWYDRQIMVFRTADPPPPAARDERRVDLGPIALVGHALEADARPGFDLPVTLYWSTDEIPMRVYSAFVHLVDGNDVGWAQDDGPPLRGVYPTTSWRPGEVLRDRRSLRLPADLPDGLYRLDSGLYDPVTMDHLTTPDGSARFTLGFVRVGKPETLPPDPVPVHAVFGEQIRLLGYTLVPTGERSRTLTLIWAAKAPVKEDYTVFVHLVDQAGNIQAQHDGPPGGGFYPTSFWASGDTIRDHHDLTLPADAPPATYRILVGLYNPETSERLQTSTGDSLELAAWINP